jgi:hypothetical protein
VRLFEFHDPMAGHSAACTITTEIDFSCRYCQSRSHSRSCETKLTDRAASLAVLRALGSTRSSATARRVLHPSTRRSIVCITDSGSQTNPHIRKCNCNGSKDCSNFSHQSQKTEARDSCSGTPPLITQGPGPTYRRKVYPRDREVLDPEKVSK